ncbi:MAG: hypothetical protein HY898_29445 [Deltaproteobacteria bacterium]|nr:hypothetical protein [Deltaproteobacteria bacterium]
MKAYAGYGLIGLTGLVLAGCPIYSNDHCYNDYDCPSNAYCSMDNVCIPYPAQTGGSGGTIGGSPCSHPDQCGANSVCGVDGYCHTGDCSFSGCVAGYKCVINDNDLFVCVPNGTPTDGGAGKGGSAGSAGTAGSGGTQPDGSAGTGGENPDASDSGGSAGSQPDAPDTSKTIYCGNPKDCPSGQICTPAGTCQSGTCTTLGCVQGYVCADGGAECVPSNPSACILDGDCLFMGAGYKCVNGTCTSQDQLCTDKTQCPGGATGKSKCVDGKCIEACDPEAGSSCAPGYVCDPALGICKAPPNGCQITDDCDNAALVCVAGACVPHCLPGGDGGICLGGLVCVANGCVPDTQPKFDCTVDGQQDVCAATSVCLHHHCYISCEGANSTICDNNPPDLNLCKTVTTASGEHKICGSNANLGSECDPTLGPACTGGKFCIDGFCK